MNPTGERSDRTPLWARLLELARVLLPLVLLLAALLFTCHVLADSSLQ